MRYSWQFVLVARPSSSLVTTSALFDLGTLCPPIFSWNHPIDDPWVLSRADPLAGAVVDQLSHHGHPNCQPNPRFNSDGDIYLEKKPVGHRNTCVPPSAPSCRHRSRGIRVKFPPLGLCSASGRNKGRCILLHHQMWVVLWWFNSFTTGTFIPCLS